MLHTTKALAALVEAAECDLLRSATQAVAEVRPEARGFARPIGGGVATYSGPDSPLNKVAGLGFSGDVDEGVLVEIERAFAERQSSVQVELSSLAEPSVGELLTRRGYVLVGFENLSGRSLADGVATPGDGADDLTVEVCRDEDYDTWLDTAVTGFGAPDEDGIPSHESFPRAVLEQVISDMSGAEGFVRYLARRSGRPVGAASIRVGGRVAQLSGAATLPEHRRRGVQTMLLARRLSDAAAAGCEVAVVTTQPGSTSQKNVHRHGFGLLYTRAVLIRDPSAPRSG